MKEYRDELLKEDRICERKTLYKEEKDHYDINVNSRY